MISEFYGPFEKELEKVEKELEHVELEEEVSDVPCEKCGRMMVVKYGRYGKFLACPGYPECKNVKPYIETIEEHFIYVRTIQINVIIYLGQNRKKQKNSYKFKNYISYGIVLFLHKKII